jgi:hypothetical protein
MTEGLTTNRKTPMGVFPECGCGQWPSRLELGGQWPLGRANLAAFAEVERALRAHCAMLSDLCALRASGDESGRA